MLEFVPLKDPARCASRLAALLIAGAVAAACSSADGAAPIAVCEAGSGGKAVGDLAADITWTDHADQAVLLSAQCGRAVLVVETSIWSTPDALAAPVIKAWKVGFGDDLAVVLVVGEDDYSNASEPGDAKTYKQDLNYSDAYQVVADPRWSAMDATVNHPGVMAGTLRPLPYFVVFDRERTVAYAGTGGDAPQYPDAVAAIEAATGKTYVERLSCEGLCGQRHASGCWCDETCVTFGDCCEDNCGVCGNCP
jgi:hypothetical protein